MAKENKNEETRTSIDNINDSLTGLEQKVQNNQKIIMWACVGAALVVCLVFLYVYAFHNPRVEAANNAIGQADTELLMGNDSTALAGYQDVADNYGGDAANRAALNAAIILYREKKYQEAIDYLDRYDAKESVVGAGARALMGDCYVNLKDYDKAIKCFSAAVKLSDSNPHYTPYFLLKEATVYHEMKNYAAEAEVYRTLIADYPAYGEANRIDFRKYMERAEILAGSKK